MSLDVIIWLWTQCGCKLGYGRWTSALDTGMIWCPVHRCDTLIVFHRWETTRLLSRAKPRKP